MAKIYNKIFFDFDSTLIKGESLDLLGDICGIGEKVKELTDLSMNGQVPLEQIFKEKVDLISPSSKQVQQVAGKCLAIIVDDVPEVIKALQFLGKEVFILSSNFHQIVDGVAEFLAIPLVNVIANNFYFDDIGNYIGFDHQSQLCFSSGKGKILESKINPKDKVVFIGDGSSDISVKGVADLFIGFGGVVSRKIVKDGADVYLKYPSMAPLLLVILNPTELNKLKDSGFKDLIAKAEKLTTTTKMVA